LLCTIAIILHIAKCWAKGGGAEGKGPKNKNGGGKSKESGESATNTAEANLVDGNNATETSDPDLEIASAWVANRTKPKSSLTMNDWIIDSGATTHITPHKVLFSDYTEFPSPRSISTADHGSLNAYGIGSMWVKLRCNGHTTTVELKHILFAPKCSANLLSINGLDRGGYCVNFKNGRAIISNSGNNVIAVATKTEGQLYRVVAYPFSKATLPTFPTINHSPTARIKNPLLAYSAKQSAKMKEFMWWHQAMGHLNFDALRLMFKRRLAQGFGKFEPPATNPYCQHCSFGKMTVSPFPVQSLTKINRPLQVVAVDICGPFPPSIGNKRYMLVFIDVYSRYVWTYFIKDRSSAIECLKDFHPLAERQSYYKLQTIRSDNAKEFIEGKFRTYCREMGINQQTTAPYSSASNGIVERVNRTIQENGLAALHQADLTMGFWPEAFEYVVYTRNKSFHNGINDVPHTKWFGTPPNVSHHKPFGCTVQFLRHPTPRRKGEYHAETGKFVGYYADSKSYKIWSLFHRQFYKT
jgi:transposase InsO family protein